MFIHGYHLYNSLPVCDTKLFLIKLTIYKYSVHKYVHILPYHGVTLSVTLSHIRSKENSILHVTSILSHVTTYIAVVVLVLQPLIALVGDPTLPNAVVA